MTGSTFHSMEGKDFIADKCNDETTGTTGTTGTTPKVIPIDVQKIRDNRDNLFLSCPRAQARIESILLISFGTRDNYFYI